MYVYTNNARRSHKRTGTNGGDASGKKRSGQRQMIDRKHDRVALVVLYE